MIKVSFFEGIYNAFNQVTENLNFLSNTQRSNARKALSDCFFIGSGVISKYIEITDIDVLFYPKTEEKFVSLNNALNILFSTNYVYETQNFDLPTKHILSTSDYKNSKGVNLSDYIFVLNRDEFSYKFGFLNAINLEAFFLTKIATIGKRNSARDIECTNIAVNLMNGVPEMIYRVIDDFSMRDNSLVNAYLNSL